MRAALYTRVSTEDQEREGTSLDSQLEACLRKAKELGYEIEDNHIIREVYSGLTLERPRLSELREWVRRKEIEVVIVYTLDRLSRDPVHFIILEDEFHRAGVKLILVTETIDSSDLGKLTTHIKGYAAKLEAEKIKERTVRGRRSRACAGKLPNGQRRWCFDYDPKTGKAVINTERAVWVRKWAEWLLIENASLGECCKRMEGIPAPKGGLQWRRSTITRILGDPSLIGKFYAYKVKMVDSKRERQPKPQLIYQEENDTVLSPEIYYAIQRKLQRNSELSPRHATLDYTPARGYVFCTCGRRMAGVPCRGVAYFRCSVCRKPTLKAQELWDYLRRGLTNILMEPQRLYHDVCDYLNSGQSAKQLEDDIAHWKQQLRGLENAEEKLLRMYVIVPDYPEDKLQHEHDRISSQKTVLGQKIQQLECELAKLGQVQVTAEYFRQFGEQFALKVTTLTKDEWRKLIEELQLRVTISPDRSVRVKLRTPSPWAQNALQQS